MAVLAPQVRVPRPGGIGMTVYAGGSGSSGVVTGSCQNGGAGGGGAGSGGAGGDASGNTAGTGTATGGGAGGAGRNNSGTGNAGSVAGGGGGAACAETTTNRNGGVGAAGTGEHQLCAASLCYFHKHCQHQPDCAGHGSCMDGGVQHQRDRRGYDRFCIGTGWRRDRRRHHIGNRKRHDLDGQCQYRIRNRHTGTEPGG